MRPEISEFSYGFAITNELVGWDELLAAPIFPSLIEEGKAGGGYDVKLDRPGLQFKRSHYMVRPTAMEYRAVVASGGKLNISYYRFPVTAASTSDQHELLLTLDKWLKSRLLRRTPLPSDERNQPSVESVGCRMAIHIRGTTNHRLS